tara:strand:- start:3435 stop:4034 length:600 start_codon:yes stop_codon:yes gene_type:complete
MRRPILILTGLIAGILLASLLAPAITGFSVFGPSEEDLIKDYYKTEVAIHVSPHHLRKAMTKGDDSFVLIDLRSAEEYEREHIKSAINIPAYKNPDKSAYDDVERIVNAFSKLPKDKEIIVYCYSIPCMTGRKIGNMLAEHDIYIKQLGIGWNEWKYYWELWNHEHEWAKTDVNDYIEVGENARSQIPLELCTSGEFSC